MTEEKSKKKPKSLLNKAVKLWNKGGGLFRRRFGYFVKKALAEKDLFSALRPQKQRRWILKYSFILSVLLPSFFGVFYYTFLASDRYVSGSGFAVRTMGQSAQIDALGALTGLAGGGSTTSDAHIILKYLKSHDVLQKLEKDFDFRGKYAHKSVDFLSRLDQRASIEELVDYWPDFIEINFDNTSSLITIEVQAFKAKDAHKLATLLLSYSEDLINKISKKAQEDTVVFVKNEVNRAEKRLKAALEKLRLFREKENFIDPGKTAEQQVIILGGLEKELLSLKARMSALSGSIDDDSPNMRSLRRQADALEKQILEKSVTLGSRSGYQNKGVKNKKTPLSTLLAIYETLEAEHLFAQKTYFSAMASLEGARVEAGQQQRYLAVYTQPILPEDPLYPRRLLSIFLLFSILVGVWIIGVLISYSVRDHLS